MESSRRPFCAERSQAAGEPLAATASRVEHWLVLEYQGLWPSDLLDGSGLFDELKAHLRAQLAALPRSRMLFVRRPEHRGEPGHALFFGRVLEAEQRFYVRKLERYEELLSLDLAAALADGAAAPAQPLDHPLILICTHGKRDRCCARYGRPLYAAVKGRLDPDWTWQTSHVGGDRFAGNLVCLPQGLYFGRVGAGQVGPLLDDYLAGRIHLDRYRGRSCYAFPVQAAERSLRERLGLTGFDDVRLESSARHGDGWRVCFRAAPAGELYEVDVVVERGEPAYLTCGAASPQRPRRFRATAQTPFPPPRPAESPPERAA